MQEFPKNEMPQLIYVLETTFFHTFPCVNGEDGLEKSISIITCIMWTIGSLRKNCPNARILLIKGYIRHPSREKGIKYVINVQ